MSWTADEQRAIKETLVGTWPGTITQWGREAVAAYIRELMARGLSAERVLVAVRTWPAGSDFPPSAPNLAAAALRDPSAPTFVEALRLMWMAARAYNGRLAGSFDTEAQMLGARERLVSERAAGLHPLVASFIARVGPGRLVDELAGLSGEYGGVRRRDLERMWGEHVVACEVRGVAALVSGRSGRDALGRLDPLAAIGGRSRGELEAGSGS